MADIFIIEAETSPVRLCVNGETATILVGVDATIPDAMIPALRTMDIKWRYVGQAGPQEVDEDPAPPFDPETIITGTVSEVEKRLPELTAEQLIAVREAENDREVARKGVLDAISKAIVDRN